MYLFGINYKLLCCNENGTYFFLAGLVSGDVHESHLHTPCVEKQRNITQHEHTPLLVFSLLVHSWKSSCLSLYLHSGYLVGDT